MTTTTLDPTSQDSRTPPRETGTRILLGVCTYRRPAMLMRLLDSLQNVRIPSDVQLRVLVVDNDAEGSAETHVRQRPAGSIPLEYVCEPQRGIASARNRALEQALNTADFLAFVDDDEWLDPNWLSALLRVQREGDFDAVFGPVVAYFPEDAPRWVQQGPWFNKQGPGVDGATHWRYASTANTLIRTSLLAREEARFDPYFNVSGSSDTDLFVRLTKAGATLGWSHQARVYEEVEPERCSLPWLLRRQYRTGLMLTRITRPEPIGTALRACWRSLRGVAQVLLGLPAAVVGRPTLCVKGLMSLSLAASGVIGVLRPQSRQQFVEYRERSK